MHFSVYKHYHFCIYLHYFVNLHSLRPAGVPDIEIPRPHKLKEEFADLHEKEWTSALKSLQKTTKSEDMSIRMLLQTLRVIFSI